MSSRQFGALDQMHPCLQGACRASARNSLVSSRASSAGWVPSPPPAGLPPEEDRPPQDLRRGAVPLDEIITMSEPGEGRRIGLLDAAVPAERKEGESAGRVLSADTAEWRQMQECLGEWLQQLQRQLQDHQVETAKLVAGVQHSVVEQIGSRLEALQEALGQQEVAKEHAMQRDALHEAERKTEALMETTMLRVFQQQMEQLQEAQRQQEQMCELRLAELSKGSDLSDRHAASGQEIEEVKEGKVVEGGKSHIGMLDLPAQVVEAVHDYLQKQLVLPRQPVQLVQPKMSDPFPSEKSGKSGTADADGGAVEALHTALGWKVRAKRRGSADGSYGQQILNVIQHVSLVLIVANTLFLGLEAELGIRSALQRQQIPLWASSVDVTFTVLFAIELCLKLLIERQAFFCGSVWRWNLFDCLLVSSSVLNSTMDMFNLSFVRCLRVLRAARAARMLRMISCVRELRLMLAAIISSMTSLLWALGLLLFMIYLFALFIMQGVQMHIRDAPLDAALPENLLEFWGSLSLSILSLFMAISGGTDWGSLASPLWACSWVYILAFAAFITLMVFGILNILTAVFVESASSIADVDRDLVIQQHLSQSASTINAIKEVFRQADLEGTGSISRAELENTFEDEETLAYFETLGLEVSEARSFFTLLDLEGKDEVGIDELISGMMRLKGAATGIDVATMMYENKRVYTRVSSTITSLEERLSHVALALGIHDLPAPRRSRAGSHRTGSHSALLK